MNTKVAIALALAGAAAFGVIVTAFGNARQDGEASKAGAFSDQQADEIRDIVRQYLVDNPEVLVDSLNAYSARQRAEEEAKAKDAAAANLAALLDPTHGVVVGRSPATARVAVVELFDYHCGYCKRAAGMVQDLTKSDPDVKVVFRELPILREESDYAAKAALAARAQGKYAELHFAMMKASGVLTKERIREIAKKEGLDVAALERAIEDPAVVKALEDTARIAEDMNAGGTPTFIIATADGSFLDVVPGFDEAYIKNAIAEAKKAAESR